MYVRGGGQRVGRALPSPPSIFLYIFPPPFFLILQIFSSFLLYKNVYFCSFPLFFIFNKIGLGGLGKGFSPKNDPLNILPPRSPKGLYLFYVFSIFLER